MIINLSDKEKLLFEDNRFKKMYRCVSCSWDGDFKPVEYCPNCKRDTYITPAMVMGNAIFFQRGRNLRIRNTHGPISNIEVEVERADFEDLELFIKAIYPES